MRESNQMEHNVLEVLGVADKEDVVSNLICHCARASRAFADALVQCLLGEAPDPGHSPKLYTRVSVPGSGVPDLLVHASVKGRERLVILENKLKAEEGIDQTDRYADPACVQSLCAWINSKTGGDVDPQAVEFVFLTLYPDQKAKSANFWRLTHGDLRNALANSTLTDPLVRQLWGDWTSLLDRFYSHQTLEPSDILLSKLGSFDPLEGSYLAFSTFTGALPLQPELSRDYLFRSSARGRRYYGAVFLKEAWRPGRMSDASSSLVADRDFSVHFEVQYQVLKHQLDVFLHHETNPYIPRRQLADRVSKADLQSYDARREAFANALMARDLPRFKFGGGSNQIGKMSPPLKDLSNSTASAVQATVAEMMNSIATHIDDVLQDLAADN